MRKNIQIGLKPGERIFINGAVLRVDRKVTIELLNDVTFLLESHVMQLEAATTPLRQLYFIVQTMLMDPANAEATKTLFMRTLALLITSFTSGEIFEGLERVSALITANKEFEALKRIRALLPLEDELLVVKAAKNSNKQQIQTKTREVA
jgi:flagellar biosynthesis repressor protein FlbT